MALTKVTGGTISTTSNYEVGVITATKFVGPFEGAVTGVATGASKVITSVESSDTTCFPLFVNSSTDAYQAPKLGSNLTFNSTTGDLGATKVTAEQFVGNISGTGATFTTVDISGTLNYTHVTDVYSVGVGTFASNVQVGAGISVVGVSTFTNGVGIADSIFHTGDNNTAIKFDTDIIKLETGGSERLHIASGGINVTGVTTTTGNIHLNSTDKKIYLTSDYDQYITANAASNYMVFAAANKERLRITSAGALRLSDTNDPWDQNTDIWVADDALNFNAYGTNGAFIFKSGSSSTERLRIRNDGNILTANDLAVTGVTTSSAYDLSAIDKSISDTAVDLFVYDTRNDSDGGAWRKRTSHTSWYNETFSATRGSKKEFPAVAVISVIGGTVSSYGSDNGNMKIKIYDGDDPEMPLWMEFEGYSNGGENFLRGGTNYAITSVSAANGVLCIGRNGGYGGALVSFIDEFMYTYWDATTRSEYGGSIAERNSGKGGLSQSGNGIINATVNDVAMTVLPNAKIMKGTGLPSPTIAFATIVGATVIKEVGIGNTFVVSQPRRVYDTNGTYDNVNNVEFTKDGKVVYTEFNGSQYGWMYVHDIPHDKDYGIAVNSEGTALSWYDTRDAGSESAQGGHSFADQDGHIYSSNAGYGVKILHTVTAPDNMIYATTTSGVTMIHENRDVNRSGLVAYVNHNYNTGWLHGDQKFCLSDTDDTDKTNTQTEYDRSIGAKNLTAYGTVTKTAVATGAEMVSWSFGNSNSNYLKQDYTAKLQFGTSSFSVMAWIKKADYSSTGFIFDRADSSGNERVAWYFESDDLKLYTFDGSSSSEIGNGTVEIGSAYDGKWIFAVATRHSSGQMETYINGVLKHSQVSTVRDVDNSDAFTIIGGRYNTSSGNQFNGEIALLRMSKSVPSPEQVAKIYNDEKDLFVANAKCTLYGSSSSITALAHDEDTDTLHVGTSGGRSDFTGLNRINNTTTAVTTAISASNGLIIEQ